MISDMTTETEAETVDRYANLKAFVAEWHRPIEPSDGYTEAEIAEAEAQLGFRLPEALRELHALVGKMDAINGATTGFTPFGDMQWWEEPLQLDGQFHGENAEAESGLWFWQESDPFDSFAIKPSDAVIGEECWFRNDNNGWTVEESLTIGEAATLIGASSIVARGRFSAVGAPESLWEEEPATASVFVFEPGGRQYDINPALEYLNGLTTEVAHPLLARHDYKMLDDCLCAIENEYVYVVAKSADSLRALVAKHPGLHWRLSLDGSVEQKEKKTNGS